ncbi:MAG: helix-turn-helix transcriptional regulator [Acidimicrobiales bacterium]
MMRMGGTDGGRTPRQAEFGDRVREHRSRLGLSQEALALKAKINRTYIASLEAGQRNPSLDLMARLARSLGIDLGDLVKGLQAKRGRH